MSLFLTKAKKEFNSMNFRKSYYVCAKCNHKIGNYKTNKYCPHCGRRVKYD